MTRLLPPRRRLHDAASRDHCAYITALLERGANLEARDDRGWTPLHAAAAAGAAEATRLLMTAGADLEAEDSDGLSPAQVAAEGEHDAVLAVLVSRDADSPLPGTQRGQANETVVRGEGGSGGPGGSPGSANGADGAARGGRGPTNKRIAMLRGSVVGSSPRSRRSSVSASPRSPLALHRASTINSASGNESDSDESVDGAEGTLESLRRRPQ